MIRNRLKTKQNSEHVLDLKIDEIKKLKSLLNDNNFSQAIKLIGEESKDEESRTLEIQRCLWNEIDIEDLYPMEPTLLLSYILYRKGVFHEVDFKVMLNKFQQVDKVDPTHILQICYLEADFDDLHDFDTWVKFYQTKIPWLGSFWINPQELIEFAELAGLVAISDEFRGMANRIASLVNRPEYETEILETFTHAESKYSLPWFPSKYRKSVVDKIVKTQVNNLNMDQSYKELQLEFEKNEFLSDLPISFPVLEERISSLEAHTIDNDSIANVPQELLQDWLPKFAYTKPETRPKIKIMFLGGQHIGHSGILMKINNGLILFDFGLSVVNSATARWHPILEKLDAIFVSHAHLDHSGGIPQLIQDSNTPIFGTMNTKIMCEMLWNDTSNLLNSNYSNLENPLNNNLRQFGSTKNIQNASRNFITIGTKKEISILPGVSVKAHDASHLFGSVGYEIIIGNKRILYTGDFNADGTKIFKGAQLPTDADLTIFDGTYFGRSYNNFPPEPDLREMTEQYDRLLIPAFSMGRSQEIFYHIKKLGIAKDWKIYMTGMGGSLTRKIKIPTTKATKPQLTVTPTVENEAFVEKTIVISGQGMLQAGTSRRLLDYTAHDDNTAVLFTGYQAPNTLGYHLANQHPQLVSKYKQKFERISMSGHTTSKTLDKFLSSLGGKELIVHTPIEALPEIEKRGIGRVTPEGLTL